MNGRARIGAGLLSILAVLAAPADAMAVDCPVNQVVLEARFAEVNVTPLRAIGVTWGLNGTFAVSDGLLDRLIGLNIAGQVTSTLPLGLLAFSLTQANGKIFFNARDASGRSVLGQVTGSNVSSQLLPNGFLNQGGPLAMRPVENGVSLSNALSALQSVEKGKILSPPKIVTSPGKPAAVAADPRDGVFYLGYTSPDGSSGLGTLQPDGTVKPVASLPAATTVIVPCGDGLVMGGLKYLARPKINDIGQITMDVTPMPIDIRGISCAQDKTAVFVGQGRTIGLYFTDGTTQTFTVPGAGELMEVATAPGSALNALLLNISNNQGTVVLAKLPVLGRALRNSTTGCRVPAPPLLFVTPQIIGSN